MFSSILAWYAMEILGSIFIAPAIRLDGHGISGIDVVVLLFLSLTGPFWMLLSVPFAIFWINSLFGEKE